MLFTSKVGRPLSNLPSLLGFFLGAGSPDQRCLSIKGRRTQKARPGGCLPSPGRPIQHEAHIQSRLSLLSGTLFPARGMFLGHREISLPAGRRYSSKERSAGGGGRVELRVSPEEEELSSVFVKGQGTPLSTWSPLGIPLSRPRRHPCMWVGIYHPAGRSVTSRSHLPLETDTRPDVIIIVILVKRCAYVVIFFIG